MKRIVLSLIAITFSVTLIAQQRSADLGFFAGGATPLTDYSRVNLLSSVKPNAGLFYRYNFNSRYSLRINGLYGMVGANGFLNDTSTVRSFQKSVLELTALFEINYLDYIMGVDRARFSPFVYYGLGFSMYNGVFTASLPIGTGVKYAFNKKWGIAAEVSAHKLMNDELDNISNPYQNPYLGPVNDYWHNNDWITYFGLTLTYKIFWGSTPCPAYNSLYN
ncbi:MAG: outer membrane beta-barrel protein [Prolixibacteraceae bacterium]|nr:outer membrane beta-barrel protein [Prolixibacteraceae bacterium]